MSTGANDPYLASLEAREEEFSARNSAIKREEDEHRARGEAIRQKREAFDQEYRAHAAAFQNYRDFLTKRGQSNIGAMTAVTATTPDLAEFPSLRIEGQRKVILAHVAAATRRGQKITSRQIVTATNISPERVSNVLWKDQRRGYVTRIGDHVSVSPKGMEFLRQAGVIDADA
jgi:hypothetical protein